MTGKTNYIDNKEFWRVLKDYKERREQAEQNGEPEPPIPEYAAKAIMLIAENLAKRPNFRGYTYVDEMIGDGIEVGIKKIRNFDPDRFDNPFGYYSRIIWNTFGDRIKKEQRQSKTKKRMIENATTNIEDFVGSSENLDESFFSDLQAEALSHWDK